MLGFAAPADSADPEAVKTAERHAENLARVARKQFDERCRAKPDYEFIGCAMAAKDLASLRR